MATTKGAEEIRAEIEEITRIYRAYADEDARFSRLKDIFDQTLADLQIHQEELTAQNSELQASQQEAEALYAYQRALFDQSPTAMVHIGYPGDLVRCANKAAACLFGYSSPSLMEGRSFLSRFHMDDHPAVREHLRQAFQTGEVASLETRVFSMDRGERYVELVSVAVTEPATSTGLCLSSLIDITDRKKAEESSRLAEKLFNRSAEGIAITDARGRILTVNEAFTDMTGYGLDEITGKTTAILDSDRQASDLRGRIRHGLEADGWWQGRIWRRQKDGEDHLTWLNVTAVRTDRGVIANTVYMLSDIRSVRTEKRRIEYFATHDELTDLANRAHFTDRIGKTIRELDSGANPSATIAVLFMDLDNFKNINDTQGHDAGDCLLQAVAGRLRSVVREEHTLARFGGDEFTLLIEPPDAEAAAIEAAKRILLAMAPPFELAGQTVFTTMSVGISLYPGDASDGESLLKHSDIAMYHAKVRGKNQYQFYTEDLMQAARRRMRLENGLRAALVQNDFDLVFQPIVDLKTGLVQGAEALLRLELDNGEAVSPDEFIPIAEQTGLISEISKWMCEKVFRTLSDWSRQGISVPDITINLSGRDIQGDFASVHLAALARQHGVNPDNVTLELTEGVLMDNQSAALETLSDLRKLGFGIAIDDFGSGFSSLAYMRMYPITTIKIDRSFLQNMDKDAADIIILQAIIDLSNRLGLRVICEGVETPEQATRLAEYGCSYGQGFYYHRPMHPTDFISLITAQNKNQK
ncbi:hypothetical protein GCM10011316_37900 [Roseibium aquae]|uniref:PAS domain S-box-containing protein/diguanylate cyclase (GGDEF)-like protein n=1 Tax=Roseibium aquae TaxID=1323746 RepID=A0A916X3X0_9HYPH|nr:EAL domain-containing protein [Roseibium aquae]GGB62390.1 hypothetical protein GCM10011316_37900 [Roseibium aquae]